LCKTLCIYFATFTGKPRCGLAAQLASIILEEKIADDYVKKIWKRNRHEAWDARKSHQAIRAAYLRATHESQGDPRKFDEIFYTACGDYDAQEGDIEGARQFLSDCRSHALDRFQEGDILG
jgi:hypothetical protein